MTEISTRRALTKAEAVKKLKKQFNRKSIVKELDKEFSLFIRNRDGKSVISGKTEKLTCSHLISRSCYSVRWNEQNAFAMTAGENYTHEFKPEIMTSWYINKYGLQAYRNLVIKSKQRSNLKTADLLVLLKYYRNLNERER